MYIQMLYYFSVADSSFGYNYREIFPIPQHNPSSSPPMLIGRLENYTQVCPFMGLIWYICLWFGLETMCKVENSNKRVA